MSEDLVLTLVFLFMGYCIICPPLEFISAGFTIESIFSRLLGNEHENLIVYHIRRSIVNLIVYACLPLGYLLSLFLLGQADNLNILFLNGGWIWKCFATSTVVLPILAIFQAKYWTQDNCTRHPIVVNLKKYCNNNNRNWNQIALDISTEFRRVDKISIRSNALTKVIATENWILKICPFTIHLIHQADASLTVKEADTHSLPLQNSVMQYVTIEVKSARPNIDTFMIRINVADFKDLEDRIGRSIAVLPNIKFHKSVLEQFVEVFKETIKTNPRYETDLDLEQCIGCLQTRPNVKLQKLCDDGNGENCTTCYCRPMWCVECMAKWFASRQDSDRKDSWLSSKCTCPLCRATFCILDVCFLNEEESD